MPGPSARSLATRAESIADEVVDRWAALQDPQGRFPDPVLGVGSDYGTPMLGLAMAQRGHARRDTALVRSGLRAIMQQVDVPTNGSFELLALAHAHQWGQLVLAGDERHGALWAQVEPRLRANLSRRGPVQATAAAAACNADPACYNNLKLVSGLAEYELLATGVAAGPAPSLLADPLLKTRILERLSVRIPAETGRTIGRTGLAKLSFAGVLSDPPRNPLAYHALSTSMLGQLLQKLGPAAPKSAMRAFERASRGLLLLAAPDGDVSYYGRGQGQVWVPAVVAEASAIAALRTTSAELRGQYLALTEASLARLRSLHGVGVTGMPLVPGAATATALASRRIDAYATTRSYNGLAVAALDRTAATLGRIADVTATTLPATVRGVVRSPKQAELVTLTRGALWAAIAARSGSPRDARYGSGVLALQHRDAAGRWAQIGPGRPYASPVVGTIAIRHGKDLLVPNTRIGRATKFGVDLVGSWSQPGGPSRAPGTTWAWRMQKNNTLELRFTARGTYTVVATGLMGDGAVMTPASRGMLVSAPDGTALRYELAVAGRHAPLKRWTHRAGASAYDAQLGAARMQTRVRRGDRVLVRISVAGTLPAGAAGQQP